MLISRICWDIGGIDPTIVYNRSKKHGLFRVIPVKGAPSTASPWRICLASVTRTAFISLR
jgi:phage terminase large subunit GpA-like protein